MEGSYKVHNLQKNSKRTNNKDKQITSVNPENPDEKDEFLYLLEYDTKIKNMCGSFLERGTLLTWKYIRFEEEEWINIHIFVSFCWQSDFESSGKIKIDKNTVSLRRNKLLIQRKEHNTISQM